MPLDPNKLYQKKSGDWRAVFAAAEWAAIIFACMLALLFLSWALTRQMSPVDANHTDEHVSSAATGWR